ncbi:MAG: ABC transporter ATP-binding protein [Candidatus Bathyarchaeia archaeon]|jgi:branched-chain amino acid transport system ATP-binding protein
MLEVRGVSSGYGGFQILEDVSLQAEEGQVSVIVGPNGSGKSTLLKTIAGLTNIYQGEVLLDDEKISGMKPHIIARSGLAYLPQTESVFVQLTVEENIRMAAYSVTQADYPARLRKSLDLFPQIRQYMKSRVQNLSGGERQMVAMTMAMMREPKVVMFDEPTANLSPKLATLVLDTVKSLAKDHKLTVLLVEQNARKALQMGDKAHLLVGGKKGFEGACRVLLSHSELSRMYLGLRVD